MYRSVTLALVLALGCAAPPTRQFEIRTRDPRDLLVPEAQQRAYREEFDYVRSRRLQLDGARPDVEDASLGAPPRNLVGIAFSGGGIRSATFSLGVLQGLGVLDLVDQLDYTSAVSGGGYLAGWQQAHLGAHSGLERDEYFYEVNDREPEDVLRNHDDHVEHLRVHSGFLNQGGWFEGGKMFLDWAWRWPFHFVLDDVLHYRGRYNFQHIIDIYRSRIEGTYFRGDPPTDRGVRSISELRLVDVNSLGREASSPYLVLNANLTNRGRSRIGVEYPNAPEPKSRKAWNFEFTRDFTGSDATGYIRSAGFGLPVSEVIERRDVPVRAVVALEGADASDFRLSEGVAASGAAFDSIAAGTQIDVWGVTELAQLVGGGVLNLNLGLDVPNFAREYDSAFGTAFDYFRMATYQRVPRWTGPDARWLQITDGGHYENLGVLALLRRGTRCVLAIDATADFDRSFGDLRVLRERAEQELNLRWVTPLPDDGSKPLARFVLNDAHGMAQAVVLYVKASADETFPHMQERAPVQDAATGKRRVETIRKDLVFAVTRLLAQVEREARDPSARFRAQARRLIELADRDVDALATDRKAVADTTDAERSARARTESATQEMVAAQRAIQLEPLAPEPTAEELAAPELPPPPAPTPEALEPLRAKVDEVRRQQQIAELERAEAEGTPETVARFDELVAKPFREALETLLAPLPEKEGAKWRARFELVLVRTRDRLDRVARRDRSPEDSREVRRDRIERIRAFNDLSRTFPHNSTLWQWYEWERFEAYRLLGFQMATTYLEPFSPRDDDPELSWCDFPGEYASEDASGTR